jgi:hypothetical protein
VIDTDCSDTARAQKLQGTVYTCIFCADVMECHASSHPASKFCYENVPRQNTVHVNTRLFKDAPGPSDGSLTAAATSAAGSCTHGPSQHLAAPSDAEPCRQGFQGGGVKGPALRLKLQPVLVGKGPGPQGRG